MTYQFKPLTVEEVLKLDTDQKIFDLISEHLFRQNRGSYTSGAGGRPNCAYRSFSSDGSLCACAAGAVLPESQVPFIGNSKPWSSFPSVGSAYQASGEFTRWAHAHQNLVIGLQSIHDRTTMNVLDDPELSWRDQVRKELCDLARQYNLDDSKFLSLYESPETSSSV